MKVYEFEKSLLNRLQESRSLLQVRGNDFIPASEIRHEWEIYAELKMEPAGKMQPSSIFLNLFGSVHKKK